MHALAHHTKPECRSELEDRQEEMLQEWRLRLWLRFPAVDPRTVHQRGAGADYFERELGFANLWLHALKLRTVRAAREANGLPPVAPCLRVIDGGRL